MRDSPLYEAAAYGVVPAQFLVGGVYLAGSFGVVPVPPLLLLLVLAHVSAPVAIVLSREAGGQLAMLEWWDFPVIADEMIEAAAGEGTGEDDDPPLSPDPRRKRRAFLFTVATTALSLVGAAVVYLT
jgi:hypothetical protein